MELKAWMEMEPAFSPRKGATFLRTCFNGLNALAGVGILSIPYALSEGGWLSFALFLLVAIICLYTGILLKRCMDSNSFVETYPDIGELAFGRWGRLTIATIMYLELYLVAIGFLILEGDNLEKLFPNTTFKVSHYMTISGKQGFVLLGALVVLPTTWLRSLGALAYVSFGGALACLVVVLCVFWSGAGDGVGFHERGSLVHWTGVPTAVSLYVFCYSGHSVFPTIYTSMKDRTQFFKVLLVCFTLCTLCYGSMAAQGYLMYGNKVQSQITLNLPTSKLSSKIAIYTTLINPVTKYALLLAPVADAVEDAFQIYNKHRFFSIMIRTLLVTSTAIFALALPFFGYLTALTGSFLSSTASVILPCLCYLKIFRKGRTLGVETVVVYGIAATGVMVATMGTYFSVKQIVTSL